MDEIENPDEFGEENRKKKKGGKEETGAAGHQGVVVSDGFYEKMGLLGAPSHLVAEVLKNWRHLQGQGLLQRLMAFAAGRARASAHAEVEIQKGKDFSLVQNLLHHLKTLPHALTQRHKFDHRNTPGPQ